MPATICHQLFHFLPSCCDNVFSAYFIIAYTTSDASNFSTLQISVLYKFLFSTNFCSPQVRGTMSSNQAVAIKIAKGRYVGNLIMYEVLYMYCENHCH